MKLLAVALLTLASGGLSLQGAAPEGVAVEGVVRSSDGDRLLAYAEVRTLGDTVSDWTDRNGAYMLQGLPPGEWEIQVVHPAHDSLQVAITVPNDRPVRLDVTLEARPGSSAEPLADFEPFRVEFTLPALLNGGAVSRVMQRLYPPALAAERIGGEAVLLLWLDERGKVARSEVSSSSGYAELDSVAVVAADSMRFRPARSRQEPLRVIVRMPVMFTVPEPAPAETEPGPTVRIGGSGR